MTLITVTPDSYQYNLKTLNVNNIEFHIDKPPENTISKSFQGSDNSLRCD